MSDISWNLFYKRAEDFSETFKNARSEKEQAQIFWIRFFEIFGIFPERIGARFESNESRDGGFIDFLWKSKILIEHKSRGKSLDAAFTQASDYFVGLPQRDMPTHICVCDFENFRLTDLINNTVHEFQLDQLAENIKKFAFLLGYKNIQVDDQEEVNLKAAKQLGVLHRILIQNNYEENADTFLVRLLFCLFAENSGIFQDNQFINLISEHSRTDGSDLGAILIELFQVLNTDIPDRLPNRPGYFTEFPYINGSLFSEQINIPAFNMEDRKQIIKLAELNWSKISTDIFGNLFQASLDSQIRHDIGAHYTSEEIIQRTIRPAIFDDLWDKFSKCRRSDALKNLHKTISNLNFLDPACGCGNFLITTYIELRRLENAILRKINGENHQGVLDISSILQVSIGQFKGIELDPFAAQIAKVSMWLTEHQMNIETGKFFGGSFVKLPLDANENIIQGDSLALDWKTLADPKNCILIGNPPYLGKDKISSDQKTSFNNLVEAIPRGRTLDYVAAWVIKAANYIEEQSSFSFVLTASIIQGEQNKPLWEFVHNQGCKIFSAHKPFNWKSNGPLAAGVHCVIISSSKGNRSKTLYDGKLGEPILGESVEHISNYLDKGENLFIESRTNPISPLPKASFGCMPNDKGGLIFTKDEKDNLLQNFPSAEGYLRQFVSSETTINGDHRFCLWTPDGLPIELRDCSQILERLEMIKEFRKGSRRSATNQLSSTPYRFGEIRFKDSPFIFIPRHSSTNRKIIPMSFFDDGSIPADSGLAIFTENLWLFALLQSRMHMEWVKTICGRIRADYRYSAKIVYNNFPVPSLTDDHFQNLSSLAQSLLEHRNSSGLLLSEIYDPKIGMPYEIDKIHKKIDSYVDQIYGHNNSVNRFTLLSEMHLNIIENL